MTEDHGDYVAADVTGDLVCGAQYPRRERGDRAVECGRTARHPGAHAEWIPARAGFPAGWGPDWHLPERPSDEALVSGAAATARVYVDAALMEFERQMHEQITETTRNLRRLFEQEFSRDAPFAALIEATKREKARREGSDG